MTVAQLLRRAQRRGRAARAPFDGHALRPERERVRPRPQPFVERLARTCLVAQRGQRRRQPQPGRRLRGRLRRGATKHRRRVDRLSRRQMDPAHEIGAARVERRDREQAARHDQRLARIALREQRLGQRDAWGGGPRIGGDGSLEPAHGARRVAAPLLQPAQRRQRIRIAIVAGPLQQHAQRHDRLVRAPRRREQPGEMQARGLELRVGAQGRAQRVLGLRAPPLRRGDRRQMEIRQGALRQPRAQALGGDPCPLRLAPLHEQAHQQIDRRGRHGIEREGRLQTAQSILASARENVAGGEADNEPPVFGRTARGGGGEGARRLVRATEPQHRLAAQRMRIAVVVRRLPILQRAQRGLRLAAPQQSPGQGSSRRPMAGMSGEQGVEFQFGEMRPAQGRMHLRRKKTSRGKCGQHALDPRQDLRRPGRFAGERGRQRAQIEAMGLYGIDGEDRIRLGARGSELAGRERDPGARQARRHQPRRQCDRVVECLRRARPVASHPIRTTAQDPGFGIAGIERDRRRRRVARACRVAARERKPAERDKRRVDDGDAVDEVVIDAAEEAASLADSTDLPEPSAEALEGIRRELLEIRELLRLPF